MQYVSIGLLVFVLLKDVIYDYYKRYKRNQTKAVKEMKKQQAIENRKRGLMPKSLFFNSKIIFIGKADGLWFHYGHNSWGNLEDVLMARGYSLQEVDKKIHRMQNEYYLSPEETCGRTNSYFEETYWVMEKALPKHLRANPEHSWEDIKDFLGIKHK